MVDTATSMMDSLSKTIEDSPAPIYARVKQGICQKINSGEWQTDQRVPSESEMVKALGVSRMTVNRALRELTDEGVLVRQQGVGTMKLPLVAISTRHNSLKSLALKPIWKKR